MPSFPRTLLLLLAMTLTLSLMGCSTGDQHVFVSTVQQPTTLTLLDSNVNQSVWEMDIPVNHKLVMDFENDTHNTDAQGKAECWVNWELYRSDDQPTDTGRNRKGTLVQSDRVDLTGAQVRMQVSYRPAPEMPGSLDAAPVPVMETAQSVADEAAAEAKAQSAMSDEAPAEEAAVEEVVAEEAQEAVEEATEATEAVEEAAEVAEEATDAAVEVQEAAEEVVVEEAVEEAEETAVEEAVEEATK